MHFRFIWKENAVGLYQQAHAALGGYNLHMNIIERVRQTRIILYFLVGPIPDY